MTPAKPLKKQTVGTVTTSHKMLTLQALLSSLDANSLRGGAAWAEERHLGALRQSVLQNSRVHLHIIEFPGSALESAPEGAVGNQGAPESAPEGAVGNRGAPESALEGALPVQGYQEVHPREHFLEHPDFPQHPREHFPEHPDFPQHPREHFPEHFQGIPV